MNNAVGSQLRKLFRNVPEAIMPKPEPVVLLTQDEARLNYGFGARCFRGVTFKPDQGVGCRYVQDDLHDVDTCELLHRVRRGVKPMGTILIKVQDKRYATDRAVLGAARGFGLRCVSARGSGGLRDTDAFYRKAGACCSMSRVVGGKRPCSRTRPGSRIFTWWTT